MAERRRGWSTVCVCAIGIALVATHARAADPDPADAGWQYTLAPYFWAAGLDGTISTDRVDAEVEADFSDILDMLDVGALLAFEAHRDRVSLVLDGVYLRMSDDIDKVSGSALPLAPPRSFDVDFMTETLMFEGFAGYDIWKSKFGSEGRASFELRGGARYWYFHSDIDVALLPGVPLPPFRGSFDSSKDWIDAVVGGCVRFASGRFGLSLAGDYGGFGWGSSSDPTWSVQGFVAYALGEHWHLGVGWRELEFDKGTLELRMSGPLIGTIYRF